MNTEGLIGVIFLLLAAHWIRMEFRLHKAEEEILKLRKEAADQIVAVANAAIAALTTKGTR